MGKWLGISVLSTEQGNWNNGFDGLARKTSEGIVYATDKARKYAIREDFKGTQEEINELFYEANNESSKISKSKKNNTEEKTVKENKRIEAKVLITAEKDEVGSFKNLEQKLNDLNLIENKKLKKQEIIAKFIDIRLFGGVFAISGDNTNLTGPLSIGFAKNTYFEEGEIVNNENIIQIGSFTSGSAEKEMKTLGSQNYIERATYTYPFIFNPTLYKQNLEEFGLKDKELQNNLLNYDLNKFRESIKYDATNLNSCFKQGTNNLFNIIIKTKNDNDNLNPVGLAKIKIEEEKFNEENISNINVSIDNIIDFVSNNKDKIEEVIFDIFKSHAYQISFYKLEELQKITTVELNFFS